MKFTHCRGEDSDKIINPFSPQHSHIIYSTWWIYEQYGDSTDASAIYIQNSSFFFSYRSKIYEY